MRHHNFADPSPSMRAMILLTGLCLTAVAVQAADWKSFSNDRYGFSVDVPASFKASAPPDNNDGLTFNSPDGRAEIRAYGHLLSDGENLVDDERETERYSAEDHLHVTYRQATARNFSMYGLKGDHIVYVRAVATCKGIAAATLWVEYPRSEKTQLDPLIAHMEKTLTGSNACWAPG
jgi:hypothetical protein